MDVYPCALHLKKYDNGSINCLALLQWATGPGAKPESPEQMELVRLRAELAKTKMGLEIVKKPQPIFLNIQREVRIYRQAQ